MHGPRHPTPPLEPDQKENLLRTFLESHELEPGEWDSQEEETGHIILRWEAARINLIIVVVLSADCYTVDMDRFRGPSRQLQTQRLRITNCYRYRSADLMEALAEVHASRPAKKMALGLNRRRLPHSERFSHSTSKRSTA